MILIEFYYITVVVAFVVYLIVNLMPKNGDLFDTLKEVNDMIESEENEKIRECLYLLTDTLIAYPFLAHVLGIIFCLFPIINIVFIINGLNIISESF